MDLKKILQAIGEILIKNPEKKEEYSSKAVELEEKVNRFKLTYGAKKSEEAVKEKDILENEINKYVAGIGGITKQWADGLMNELKLAPEIILTEIKNKETIYKLREIGKANPGNTTDTYKISEHYEKLTKIVDGLEYTADDIGCLVRTAINLPPRYGIFISALVNKIIKPEDTIKIQPNNPLDYLGYMVKHGNLIIINDAGAYTGKQMQGGRIVVEGNTGSECGSEMENGTIIIQKNAGNSLGNSMKNGLIEVMGDAAHGAGSYMKNGRIIIHGKAGSSLAGYMICGLVEAMSDAGDYAACEIKGGEVIVGGNAGNNSAKEMRGGTVRIKGSAGDNLAENMHDGVVEIRGNAGKNAGKLMNGGLLKINGDAGDLLANSIRCGRIVVNGKAGKEVGINRYRGIIELKGGYESLGKTTDNDQTEIYIG